MSLLPTSVYAGPTQGEALWAVAGSVGPGGGVTQLVAGTNITLDPSTGEGVVTINAAGGGGGGVTSVTASGAGITATPTSGAVVVANTGVTSLVAGGGISLSGSTGAVTVTNTGAPVSPGFATYDVTSDTAEQVIPITGSCGRINIINAPFTQGTGGAAGYFLGKNVVLQNPTWNSSTVVLVQFGPYPNTNVGGGSSCSAYRFASTPGSRSLYFSATGAIPTTWGFTPPSIEFVVIQGA